MALATPLASLRFSHPGAPDAPTSLRPPRPSAQLRPPPGAPLITVGASHFARTVLRAVRHGPGRLTRACRATVQLFVIVSRGGYMRRDLGCLRGLAPHGLRSVSLDSRSGTRSLQILGLQTDVCPKRPKSGRSRPYLDNAGPISPEFAPADFRPKLANFNHMRPNSAKTHVLPEITQFRPHIDSAGSAAMLARTQQTLGRQTWTRCRTQTWPGCGQSWFRFGQSIAK